MPLTKEGHLYTGYTIKEPSVPSQLSLPFEPEHTDERPEILVIGDYLEDEWYECSSVAISAEAPVPVVKAIPESVETFTGGMGNVATNLEAMGWKVHWVQQPSWVGPIYNIPTKTRYKYHGSQVFRADHDDRIKFPIDQKVLEHFLDLAAKRGLPVVVADYNKGAIDEECVRMIGEAIRNTDLPFYIHTKRQPHVYTNRVSPIFFYNEKEYRSLEPGWQYRIVVTKGAAGAMETFGTSARADMFASARSTCGAGDVFMAAYVTAKELYGHPNPLLIADAIAKKTVTECDYTCVYRGGFNAR